MSSEATLGNTPAGQVPTISGLQEMIASPGRAFLSASGETPIPSVRTDEKLMMEAAERAAVLSALGNAEMKILDTAIGNYGFAQLLVRLVPSEENKLAVIKALRSLGDTEERLIKAARSESNP